jgi:lactoylglutathione lyase
MYLSYVGIRVTNLDRSLKFYTELFGLREVTRGDNTRIGAGIYVLLKDQKSGQKLELNFYPEDSRYDFPYTPGEGLDHIAFRVNSVKETIKELKGVQIADPQASHTPVGQEGYHVAYVKDPDGNWIELYDHPEPIGPSVPEGY